jgi:hypothetical protein
MCRRRHCCLGRIQIKVHSGSLGPECEAQSFLRKAEFREADLRRWHGVSDARTYTWEARFGGMDVSERNRLRALEGENSKLKRMLADAILVNVAPEGIERKTC